MADKTKIASGNEYELIEFVPAIILYPSFATPAILTKGEELEILLLGKSLFPITKANVAYQLKIDNTFDSLKIYHKNPLPMDAITIEKPLPLTDAILQTENKKFFGILDERIKKELSSVRAAAIGIPDLLDILRKGNYSLVYSVQIKNKGLFYSKMKNPDRDIFNLIWVPYKMEYNSYLDLTNKSIPKKQKKADEEKDPVVYQALNPRSFPEKQIIPKDIYSNLMHSILDNENTSEKSKNKKPWWKYCFKNGDPSISNFDPENPIQEYHPVFYFENLDAPNIAHLADIHLSARQHLFRRSRARVINSKLAEDISPRIKDLINCSKENFEDILNQCGDDPHVHIILISGDLIDYLQSLFLHFNKNWNMEDIWMLVNSSKKDSKNFRFYKYGVDYITLFSILLKFYREKKKPVFIVKGNHDAYCEPFGIAPRAITKGSLKRANEGIPADHNLTTFEALLMFGKSYHEHNKMFEKAMWIWYHTLLTPFSDFSIQLPKHCLVGLGWGDDEDVIGVFKDTNQDILGHLPRSDQAISDDQKKLFENVIKNKSKKKIILMTHFTFISYRDYIPISSPVEGKIYYVMIDDQFEYGKYDWGTFESNRHVFYKKYLTENRDDVQLVLSGHSHRKGIYSLVKLEHPAVITQGQDFNHFNEIDRSYKYPVIIVSDSIGPIPRCNQKGEFNGWGSDIPSGTKIACGDNNCIQSISLIKSKQKKSKPRFVVAVDYYDIIEKNNVIKNFKFEFLAEKEAERKSYNFGLELDSHIAELAYVDKIFLYAFDSKLWDQIEMKYNDKRWCIYENKLFKNKFIDQKNQDHRVFIAIKFGTNHKIFQNQYNFDSYWCFPVRITSNESYGIKTYKIIRDKSASEYPEWEWYSKYFNN